MKHFKHPVFIVSLLLVFNGCASYQSASSNSTPSVSVLDRIIDKELIRVGTTGDYLPFSYQLNNEPDEYHGIDIAMAKDLGNSLNVKVEFVKTTWPTLLEDLTQGKFDIAMSGVTITLARQATALFSIPLYVSGKSAITKDADADEYRTLEAINRSEVRVIVNPGGTNEAFARKNFPEATIVMNEDNLSIFQKIVDGKADVMITDASETLVQELIHPELEAVNPHDPFNYFELGFLLPRDLIFKEYIDQWIHFRKKDGTYEQLFNDEFLKIKENINHLE